MWNTEHCLVFTQAGFIVLIQCFIDHLFHFNISIKLYCNKWWCFNIKDSVLLQFYQQIYIIFTFYHIFHSYSEPWVKHLFVYEVLPIIFYKKAIILSQQKSTIDYVDHSTSGGRTSYLQKRRTTNKHECFSEFLCFVFCISVVTKQIVKKKRFTEGWETMVFSCYLNQVWIRQLIFPCSLSWTRC